MTDRYADIIIDLSAEALDRTFQYRIPENLMEQVRPGSVVMIPFGRANRLVRGYVLQISGQPKFPPEKLKELSSIVTDQSSREDRLIALALWMRDYYGSTTLQALRTVLPMREQGPRKVRRTIVLKMGEEEARARLGIYRDKHQTARARLLEALLAQPSLPWEIVTGSLRITGTVIKALEEQQVLACEKETYLRTPQVIRALQEEGEQDQSGTDQVQSGPLQSARRQSGLFQPDPAPSARRQSGLFRPDPAQFCLTPAQAFAVSEICQNWETEPAGRFLLHGVTGSGKTEVYMEVIARALQHGQQAILLIPEISLTYQNVLRFYRRFGDRISVLHSRLTPAERFDQFERAKEGEIDIMIGPRSALFTPFPNLGVIIIDEEHESSYQSESVPCYHARETALQRCMLENCRLVLGSATPSVEAFYGAEHGQFQLLNLPSRAAGGELPTVHMVDMRMELREGNRSILSRLLREKIRDTLKDGHQVMLFLNRRGYAGFISCRACGYVVKCPHCDVSLTAHRNGRMVCHYCGYETAMIHVCPQCGFEGIGGFRAGTQQMEQIVQEAFPQARILRMDADTTRGKDGHAEILRTFGRQEADILIGTQMIVKGHDFPQVALMGILAADLSLHAADYRAAERTFQLITQASGRAGRGRIPGEVIIQSYAPDHYAIADAAAADYQSFYEQEIAYRSISGYPPVGKMLGIHCMAQDLPLLETGVSYLAQFIRRAGRGEPIQVLGPADEPIARIKDQYRKVIYIKHEKNAVLTALKNKTEQYIGMNEGFRDIRIRFEMN